MFGVSKASSLLVAVTFSLALMLSAPATADRETVTFRPLSDWLKNNPPTFGWTTAFDLLPEGYFAFTYRGLLASGVEGVTERDGYVLERVLRDGRAEITVNIHEKNAPLTVYRHADVFAWDLAGFPEDSRPRPVLGPGLDGSLDHFSQFKFILPGPGQEIPRLFRIPFSDIISFRIAGSGSGTFTDYAENFGFTPGKTGMVQITQQGPIMAAFHAEFRGALEDFFPAELVEIHEVGVN